VRVNLDGHLRRPLLVAALLFYVGDFGAFLAFERPGLGIGHGLYIAIACAALATNTFGGAAAGLLATGVYASAIYVNPAVPTSSIPTLATGIRLVTYVLVGTLIGYYASRSRTLLTRADELAEELRILTRRDFLTGLPNQRAFEMAANRRLDEGVPFVLVVCEIPKERNGLAPVDQLLACADRLTQSLEPDADVARVTNDQFAVLARVMPDRTAAQLTNRVEQVLESLGGRPVGGWGVFPQDGTDALGLYTAASERLYARRIAQGEWQQPLAGPIHA
jgi:GGDEF domain-containing protein